MIGAIAGDIIGSVYEWNTIKTTAFPLFCPESTYTDDTVLTVATADAILCGGDYTARYKEFYQRYPGKGYGGMFSQWAASERMGAYNSFGNGSAMRVSPVGYAYGTLEEVLREARCSAEATHNHPEGIKGAQATAAAIFLARQGSTQAEIGAYIHETFNYDVTTPVEQIRPGYSFDETCQKTVPQAIRCFMEAHSFEDAIRLAVSLGGDSDTLACISGGIAQAFFGVPKEIEERVFQILDPKLAETVHRFCRIYGINH